jgi:tRNA/rRNA methyltransferase
MTAADARPEHSADRGPATDPVVTRFVLVQTSHHGNVGAAARAMKVMGFDDLVLVAPRFADAATHASARAMASGALDVLGRARIVQTLPEALDGITHVCATAMTPRDFGPATHAPREHLAALVREASSEASNEASNEAASDAAATLQGIAFVFGGERFGLSNDDVYRCHVCLSIPTHGAYGSLNLAQAVQVVAYEWRQALGGYAVVPRTAQPAVADARAIDGLLVHWREALERVGYLDPDAPKKLMPRLNQLLTRVQLRDEEVHILRGVARAIVQRCR